MNIISVIMLAFAMTIDTFAVAVGKGASMQKPRLMDALRLGLVFASVEAVTLVIGWVIGSTVSGYISQWSTWITFILLVGLGVHMIHTALKVEETEEAASKKKKNLAFLIVTSLATGIDSLAIGVGLALMDVSIITATVAIGFAAIVMVIIGTLLGGFLGSVFGKRAEIFGGVVLILVGSSIVVEYLLK